MQSNLIYWLGNIYKVHRAAIDDCFKRNRSKNSNHHQDTRNYGYDTWHDHWAQEARVRHPVRLRRDLGQGVIRSRKEEEAVVSDCTTRALKSRVVVIIAFGILSGCTSHLNKRHHRPILTQQPLQHRHRLPWPTIQPNDATQLRYTHNTFR